MKKLLSIALCVLMVVSTMLLAGCTEQQKFVGKWEAKLDMTDYLNETLGASVAEMGEYIKVEDFTLILYITFNSDGTYSESVDMDKAKETFEDLKDDLCDGMRKYFEDTIAKNGLNMTVDELLAASNMDLEALIDQSLSDDMIKEIADEAEAEGNYEVKDGKVFLSAGKEYAVDEDVYCTYSITDDALTLIESFGGEDDAAFADMYPLTLKKVD